MIESIELKNISFAYASEKSVVENLNFKFPLNGWTIFKGGLGSGKSTIIKLMLGLVTPTQGEIFYNHRNIHEMGFEDFSVYLGNIGHVLEEDGLLANQSLFENLELPLMYHKNMSLEDRAAWINIWVKELNLWHAKDLRPAFATAEVRKMFSILRAIIIRPEMLIMHNPFKYLSETNIERVLKAIHTFEEKFQLKHVIIFGDDDRLIQMKNAKFFNLVEGKIQ